MNDLKKINEYVYELCIPFKDIFTTVYFVKSECGVLLFDTASYDYDVDGVIIPALRELGVHDDELKYVFISHNHTNHSGGLCRLLEAYPRVCVISRSEALREQYKRHSFLSPTDGEKLLGALSVVYVTGHTNDSAALYDKRTKTLISGDCLQLYGIFGLGRWGANISFPTEYMAAIQKLREMEIDAILTAHDYHPCGRTYFGKAEIERALNACLAPFDLIKQLIEQAPDSDDEAICKAYNTKNKLPTLGVKVVTKYRESVKNEFDKH